jgi:tryptophanyl-tRNA synthetase
MSKSYGNTIDLFGDEKDIKKRIMSIKTDATPVEAPKPTEDAPLYALLKLLAPTPADFADVDAAWRAGGKGYGDFKKKLLEWFHVQFDGPRARRQELLADTGHVEKVLADGASRARASAAPVLQAVKRAAGL